jgi:Protein of unknown function (DUF3892)
MSLRVICIDKADRHSPHQRIGRIGGLNRDGTRWLLTLDEAIAGIVEGRYTFYVQAGARAVDVIVAEHEGHKYLKTEADGYVPDDLLSLPDCG